MRAILIDRTRVFDAAHYILQHGAARGMEENTRELRVQFFTKQKMFIVRMTPRSH
jgi:hypothetical protein